MIRSPPNTLQRSQFYSRHTNNDPLHTHSSTQKPTQRSPITTPSLACTPKHMLYRVPKSIIKTGGSTRNVDSVIKPREFGKYLEAFRRPGSSTNTATIPITATATATATSTASRDTTNHLLTRAPLPPHPLPHSHLPLTTAPATPCVPDPAILATKIVETSSVKSKPQVGKPPLNRNASTDSVVTTIENRENICNDAIEIDNPFQPRQKAMRRTPPKTVAATPQECHTVEVPKVLSTEETTESIMTKSTVIVQKCPDGDVTESKSEVQVLCSDDQVENEVLQALAPLPPLPPTRRVTTGRVMHSPPSVIQNSPSRIESSKMNVSPMGSSMYRLLSNGYAPADDTPVTGCLPTKEAVRSPCMESTRNSTPANEVVIEQEITDAQKCQEVDIHAEKAIDIEHTTTVDPVQQYAEKLSKQFADNNSPQCMTGFEQQEVSSFPICSPLPVVEVPVQINEAEFVSVSTSMSFIDNSNLGSKSQTSDVDISMSDRLLEEKEALQQTFDNKMETITSAHFYKEKELRMDLLLQRYYGNYVLQDVLDVKKELRDEKTQRIETEIQVWEANRLLYQSSTTKSQSSTTTTLASSPSVVVENCYNDIVDTKSMNESPITQHLSLDFSSIPADQDEDVSDLSLSCIQELNKSMKSELFMDSTTSTSHSVMEEDQNDAVTTQEIYDNNSGGCELTTEDSTSTCDSVDDDVAVSHGMRFIPLRSSKLCRAVGHVAKPSKISTTSLSVMKKAPTQTKKRAQGDVIQESLSATTEINVEEQEDHKPKRTCQKKTPIKPTKRRASRKEENEVPAMELAVVDDVDKSQEGEAQEISISESKKSAATSKAKTKSTAKTGGNTKAKPNTKPKAKPKAKSKACTIFNDVIENDEPESMKEDEDAKEKNKKLSKATKKKTVKKVDKKADHETSVVNDVCSENKEAYGKFCDFTRPGVEDILSKESKVGTKSKSKKIIDPSKVDDMLSQMWNIQTDSERARWAHNDVELLEKASTDLEVEVVKDVPKRAKSTKKKDVTTKETQLTPVLELPDNTATTTSVNSISRVAVMEEEVLTPVQLPTKIMSKRQKRSKLIDEEIEKQDNIQEFAPKRKIVKKMNAPEANHAKKASLFPNQGISYPKILPLKSKMNAIIPKLKSRK